MQRQGVREGETLATLLTSEGPFIGVDGANVAREGTILFELHVAMFARVRPFSRVRAHMFDDV